MLDGNAIAGTLDDIFGGDMTLAVSTCSGCGRDARWWPLRRLRQRRIRGWRRGWPGSRSGSRESR